MSATPATYFPGETVRIWVSDLTHIDDGAITEGATVTFVITDLANNVQDGGGSGQASADDWYIDITTPTTPGSYVVKATAVVGEVVWKGKMPFAVGSH